MMHVQYLIKHSPVVLHQSPQIILDSHTYLLAGILQQIIAYQRLAWSGRQQPIRIHQTTDKESPLRQQVTIILAQQHTLQIHFVRVTHRKLRPERQHIKHSLHPTAFSPYPKNIKRRWLKNFRPVIKEFLAGCLRVKPYRRRRIHQLFLILMMQIDRIWQHLSIADQYLLKCIIFKKMHPVILGMQYHLRTDRTFFGGWRQFIRTVHLTTPTDSLPAHCRPALHLDLIRHYKTRQQTNTKPSDKIIRIGRIPFRAFPDNGKETIYLLLFQPDSIVAEYHRFVIIQKDINTSCIILVNIAQSCNSIHTVLQQLTDKGIRITINMLWQQGNHSFEIDLKQIIPFFLHAYLLFSPPSGDLKGLFVTIFSSLLEPLHCYIIVFFHTISRQVSVS